MFRLVLLLTLVCCYIFARFRTIYYSNFGLIQLRGSESLFPPTTPLPDIKMQFWIFLRVRTHVCNVVCHISFIRSVNRSVSTQYCEYCTAKIISLAKPNRNVVYTFPDFQIENYHVYYIILNDSVSKRIQVLVDFACHRGWRFLLKKKVETSEYVLYISRKLFSFVSM